MDIDLVALLKQAGVTVAQVVPAIAKMDSCDNINKAVYTLWITPSAWHEKRKLSLNDGATLSEEDWKYICRVAKARCTELGGEFKDPTVTTSFGPGQ